MTQLIEIQQKIEALTQQAEDLKTSEFKSTLESIVKSMKAFGITVEQLVAADPSLAPVTGRRAYNRKTSKLAKVREPVAAKYKGPNGESWSGRGLTPRWLKAQIDQGKTKASFSV